MVTTSVVKMGKRRYTTFKNVIIFRVFSPEEQQVSSMYWDHISIMDIDSKYSLQDPLNVYDQLF